MPQGTVLPCGGLVCFAAVIALVSEQVFCQQQRVSLFHGDHAPLDVFGAVGEIAVLFVGAEAQMVAPLDFVLGCERCGSPERVRAAVALVRNGR